MTRDDPWSSSFLVSRVRNRWFYGHWRGAGAGVVGHCQGRSLAAADAGLRRRQEEIQLDDFDRKAGLGNQTGLVYAVQNAETVLPLTSINGITGVWSGTGVTTEGEVDTSTAGEFVFTFTPNEEFESLFDENGNYNPPEEVQEPQD